MAANTIAGPESRSVLSALQNDSMVSIPRESPYLQLRFTSCDCVSGSLGAQPSDGRCGDLQQEDLQPQHVINGSRLDLKVKLP